MYLTYRRCRCGSYNVAILLWKGGFLLFDVAAEEHVPRRRWKRILPPPLPPHEQKTMWRQPEGRGPTARSRNARASALPTAQMSLLCLARSCGLANETPAMCPAVCAET